MKRVEVVHRTRLDYASDVTEAVMDVRVGPYADTDQRVERFELRVRPSGAIRRYDDGFANAAHLITVPRAHRVLEVTAQSEVVTLLDDPFQLPDRPPRPLTEAERWEYLLPTELVPRMSDVEAMATPFRPAAPEATFESLHKLTQHIYERFTYRQSVTDVGTTIAEVLAGGAGVCQDFAHLMLGLVRSLGVPARYVSGYIVSPASGRAGDGPARGGGASHAWIEAYTPTHGWRGFDPTNNLVANTSYVKVGLGRDYRDVPPSRGTYRGDSEERLSVEVLTRLLD